MSWKKEPKLERLLSIRDGMEKVITAEAKKVEDRMKNFIRITEIKMKHEKRKKDGMGTKTNTGTTT